MAEGRDPERLGSGKTASSDAAQSHFGPTGWVCLVGAGRSAEAEFELSVGARERSASRVPAGRLSTLFSSCRTQNVHIARCTARFTGSVS